MCNFHKTMVKNEVKKVKKREEKCIKIEIKVFLVRFSLLRSFIRLVQLEIYKYERKFRSILLKRLLQTELFFYELLFSFTNVIIKLPLSKKTCNLINFRFLNSKNDFKRAIPFFNIHIPWGSIEIESSNWGNLWPANILMER